MSYGQTLLQIVNRILRRLREDEVVNYNDTTYSKHVTDILNQVKSEIEDAWMWHALRDTFDVTCIAGTSSYALTDSGARARILDGWNYTHGLLMFGKGTNKGFNRKFFGAGSGGTDVGSPTEYIQAGLDANLDISVDVYPVPTASTLDTLKFTVYVPQDDLAANATVPLVPQGVLIEETVARLMAERGEEGAAQPQPGAGTFLRQDLLSSAIAHDGAADDSEFDWVVE